jgi:hypothetical protein
MNFNILCCLFLCFVGGGDDKPGAMLVYVPGGCLWKSHMVCDAHLFVLLIDTQAVLEAVMAVRNDSNISQCSSVWGSFP